MTTDQAVSWAMENDEVWDGLGKPYPDVIDADSVPGYVIVAGLDAGKEYAAPTLSIYTYSEFISFVNEWRSAVLGE